MGIPPLESLPPTKTLELENGLSLLPRVKLELTVHPTPSSVAKQIDEWKLKRALMEFLKNSLSVSIEVPEEDLEFRRFKDLKKRKREDPVAHGTLSIRDLGFLTRKKRGDEGKDEDVKEVEKKFVEWRKYIVEKLDGIELNLEGDQYKLSVDVPASDDFQGMKKSWEEASAFGSRGFSRGGRQEPDTIVVRGVPSRWFAEPRVSSKPSMLVTHTIFSAFGKIRNLSVVEDNQDKVDDGIGGGDIISGLHCKIVVQFEKYTDFCNSLRVLCGRSLQKQGSRLKADYEVTWSKDGFFQNARNQAVEKSSRTPATFGGHPRNNFPSRVEPYISRFNSEDTRRKRFKE
ncbi:unnamed protein product [Linum trigynum]|uniref:A-kinase anchor protein 17A n=1 Tax=Linum trigynum TaxID=586398 RepID=A0AAV2FEE2_9ROSI